MRAAWRLLLRWREPDLWLLVIVRGRLTMKKLATLLTFLALSPATAQDNKYAGTGMSVTGPASEKKAPEPAKPAPAKDEQPKATSGAHQTSDEEVPGANSAITNSH
jgi:hypothetical protein